MRVEFSKRSIDTFDNIRNTAQPQFIPGDVPSDANSP
jgi:hypothetical protein